MPQSNKKTHDVASSHADHSAHTAGESKQPEPSPAEEASTDSKDVNSSEEEKKVCIQLCARMVV